MEDVRAHEGENGHDVVQNGFGCESGKTGHQEEGLIERLGVITDLRFPNASVIKQRKIDKFNRPRMISTKMSSLIAFGGMLFTFCRRQSQNPLI